MSPVDATIDSRRFPVFSSVVRAYWNVFSRPWRLIVLALVPAVANLIVAAIVYIEIRNGNTWNELSASYLLLLLFPLSYLGLAWARQSSRQTRPRVLSARPWSGSYAKSLGCHLLWVPFLYFTLISAEFTAVWLAQAVIAPNGESRQPAWIGPGPAFIILVYLLVSLLPAALARLFLVMPMAAAGHPASLRAAWSLSRGFTFRLASATFAMSLSHLVLATAWLFIVIAGLEATLYSHVFDIALVDTFLIHVHVGMLATCIAALPFGTVIAEALFAELMVITYREITGWTGVQQDIVERFD